jgi:hypothetical protein
MVNIYIIEIKVIFCARLQIIFMFKFIAGENYLDFKIVSDRYFHFILD